MARHRFTLAALATLAVPGLEVAVTRTFTGGGEAQHDSALITDSNGDHLVVRAPSAPNAGARLTAETRALAALTAGVRARLPFAVPSTAGVLPAPQAVVTTYVPGSRLQPAAVKPDGDLVVSIGRAIAAVHGLPSAVVADAGLPVATAADCARQTDELIRRADSTGDVPLELVNRWTAAAADPTLWRFRPVVVHGGLAAESLLVSAKDDPDQRVTGMLSWSGLQVGDPAKDLSWVLGLPAAGAAGALLHAYSAEREADPTTARRALLYAELELARWLLHGTETGDAIVIDDAVQMLEALLAAVLEDTAGTLDDEPLPTLTVTEVERMLDARHQRAASASRAPVAAHAARSAASE